MNPTDSGLVTQEEIDALPDGPRKTALRRGTSMVEMNIMSLLHGGGEAGLMGPPGPPGADGVDGLDAPPYTPTSVPVVLSDADIQDIHGNTGTNKVITWTGIVDPASFTESGGVLTALEDMELNIHACIAVTNYTPRKSALYAIAVRNDDYVYMGSSIFEEGIMSTQIRVFIATGENLSIEVFTVKENHNESVNLDPIYSQLRIERIS